VIRFFQWEIRKKSYNRNCGHSHEDLYYDRRGYQVFMVMFRILIVCFLFLSLTQNLISGLNRVKLINIGIQWMRVALSNRSSWVGSFSAKNGNIQFPKHYLLFRILTTEKVQKHSSFNCNVSSSNPFIIELVTVLWRHISCLCVCGKCFQLRSCWSYCQWGERISFWDANTLDSDSANISKRMMAFRGDVQLCVVSEPC